jgi:protein SCO1/2
VLLAGPSRAESGDADPHAHHKAMAKSSTTALRSTARYEIPDLAMIDQHGETVSTADLFDSDQPVMVNFIFTTCTAICPMMTSIFQQVQTRLGDDAERILMVSVSIDPEEDTPEVLGNYAERFKAGPQWTFLTGSLEDSIAVQRAFDAYRGDKMNHAPLTLIRAGDEMEWIRFDGFSNAEELAAQARELL